jgi:hypothetical protein
VLNDKPYIYFCGELLSGIYLSRVNPDHMRYVSEITEKDVTWEELTTDYLIENLDSPTPLNSTTVTFTIKDPEGVVSDLDHTTTAAYPIVYNSDEDFTGNYVANREISLDFTWA